MEKRNKILLLFSSSPDLLSRFEFTFLYNPIRICLKISTLLKKEQCQTGPGLGGYSL